MKMAGRQLTLTNFIKPNKNKKTSQSYKKDKFVLSKINLAEAKEQQKFVWYFKVKIFFKKKYFFTLFEKMSMQHSGHKSGLVKLFKSDAAASKEFWDM